MRTVQLALSVLVAVSIPAPTRAEPPPEIAAELRGLGRELTNWPRTLELYAPLHRPQPDDVRIERGIAYGPHPSHLLDVFRPLQEGSAPRRILLFVPGGAFVNAPRRIRDTPFYDNVGVWAARNDMIAVLMSHRTLPEHTYPAAQEDIAAVLTWLSENAGRLGGDPDRVAVLGFSAGAIHLASFVGNDLPGARLRPDRFAFVSGYFDLRSAPPATGRSYFGADEAARPARLAREMFRTRRDPLFIAYSELDLELMITQGRSFASYMCELGRCPMVVSLTGHNHGSAIFSIGTSDRALSVPLLAFLRDRPR